MRLRVEPLTPEYAGEAKRFNQRMRAGGAADEFLLPERPGAAPLATAVDKQHYIVLSEDEARGGVILQKQTALVGGQPRIVWNVQAPVSEGLVDPAYSAVAIGMMRELTRLNPLLYSVGMGSAANRYPRFLKALGWSLHSVPFYFRVCRAKPFFRNIQALRSDWRKRLLCDAAAWTGLGSVAIHAVQAYRARSKGPRLQRTVDPEFGPWADTLWNQSRELFSFAAVRSACVLNALFPASLDRMLRVRVRDAGVDVGWAAALISESGTVAHFGKMRLGTIVDSIALPGRESQVLDAAVRALQDCKADLVVSNQMHVNWQHALRQNGFLNGPSNFLVAMSRQLTELSVPVDRIHVNRADGDGIINL